VEKSTRRRPVLIVDDDADTREALRALLETRAYPAVVAGNGAEALHHLRGGLRPSLIVLDLMMPEKNGLQFRVEQLLDPALADIPVLVCSGDGELRFDGLALGAVACLTKPVDVEELLAIVHRHCGECRGNDDTC
jgi:two-component system, chemotaxis family, chemotaxis protein CheY